MKKPYYIIEIKKITDGNSDRSDKLYGQSNFGRIVDQETTFQEELTVDEVVEFMGFIINSRRRNNGK